MAETSGTRVQDTFHEYGGTVRLGNIVLHKPVLRTFDTPTHRAPDWMVEIPDVTKSNVETLETYSELFDWHAEYSRKTLGHTASEMFTSAAIEHTEVSLLIPAGTYTALIRQKLNNGSEIPTITIKRLGNVAGDGNLKKELQTLVYSNCLFTRASQNGDFFAIAFRFTKVEETNFEFGQEDESSGGQNVATIDYAKLTVA